MIQLRSIVLLGIVAALLLGVFAYTRPAGETNDRQANGRRRASVLLISIDTLRADHLGSYGYPRATSPTIDALAARGVLFEQAYSHSPKTAMSHMSIMTGLIPEAHGVEQWEPTGSERLSDDIPTLATLLRQQGYRTLAVTAGGHVRAELGFDQGMDSFEDIGDVVQGFDALGDRIAQIVATDPMSPFFGFVHTYEVHDPYMPRAPYDRLFTDPEYTGRIPSEKEIAAAVGHDWQRQHELFWSRVNRDDPRDVQRLKDLYDGSIRLTDDQIARLLNRLSAAGVLDDTLVVVLSDHGEEFLEHGMFQHEQVYQELLHVPLIFAFPEGSASFLAGHREPAVTRLIDVMPTILDFLGLPVPVHVQGVSLLPLLRGGHAPPVEVMSSWQKGGWEALRLGDEKLIRRTDGEDVVGRELYRLDDDPHEQHNLWESHMEPGQQLEAYLQTLAMQSRIFLARQSRGQHVLPSEETLERLRALGY